MRASAGTIFLLFLMQTAVSPFAIAQESASSTMDVSVRVVEAGNITAVPQARLVMNRDGTISGSLGYVTIVGVKENRMVVETQRMIKLKDDNGNRIELPVSVSQSGTSDGMNVKFATHRSVSVVEKNQNEGIYQGTMTTKIEYL